MPQADGYHSPAVRIPGVGRGTAWKRIRDTGISPDRDVPRLRSNSRALCKAGCVFDRGEKSPDSGVSGLLCSSQFPRIVKATPLGRSSGLDNAGKLAKMVSVVLEKKNINKQLAPIALRGAMLGKLTANTITFFFAKTPESKGTQII